jgi:hypothetical protein
MSFDGILAVASAIVTVALVTTIVSHPYTSGIITSAGNAFTGSLKAAEGN